MTRLLALIAACALLSETARGAPVKGVTSLTDASVKYEVPKKHYVILKRGDVEAVIVDNAAVDDEVLPKHRAGYSGVAVLRHRKRKANLFVPGIAGLNFEHVHDGTTRDRDVLFEPRRAPMELRNVSDHVVELYQKPTPTWGLESCLRYELLEDGTIELTIEHVARRKTFRNGYVGLFFASYVHQPESLDVHFKGSDIDGKDNVKWIRGITPKHGVRSTHVGVTDERRFTHDKDFPLTLVYNRSNHRYREPWYFGVSRGMAFVQTFRPRDNVRLTQSPSGGGRGNPAWDFQYFIEDVKIGRLHQVIMRASYLPFESREQVAKATAQHHKALGQ